MPLYTADPSIDHLSLLLVPEKFIIFYSSIVDGQLWCPVRFLPPDLRSQLMMLRSLFKGLQGGRPFGSGCIFA
jgi:hypothetical protein